MKRTSRTFLLAHRLMAGLRLGAIAALVVAALFNSACGYDSPTAPSSADEKKAASRSGGSRNVSPVSVTMIADAHRAGNEVTDGGIRVG